MKKFRKYKVRKQLEWYSFIIISLVTILVLVYFPMLTTIRYSFYDASAIGYGEKYVGLKNFRILLTASSFPKAMWNTVVLLVLSFSAIPIGFLLAYMINSLGKGRLQSFFRAGFYLPNIINSVCAVMILKVMLKSNDGLFNNFLSLLLHTDVSVGWISDARFAKLGATLMYLWANVGYTMLINLANLQSIPEELYDAASVDGAGSLKKCLYITIPGMRPCFLFLFITGIISGMARFTDLFVLGGNTPAGVPAGTLQTIMMYIYQYSFDKLEYGISCAGALVLFGITFIFALISAWLSGFFKDER